jgi:hypothetical protein
MTKEDYFAGLEFLKLKKPDYALLASLEKGYSAINCKYLNFALNSIPETAEENRKEKPLQLILIEKERSKLFGERAKLSNKFHDCSADTERARISDQVQIVQRKIEAFNLQIRHYNRTGKLPEEQNEFPEDPIELMKKRDSLRSSISYFKRELEQLYVLPQNHPEREKIESREEKLRELKMKLDRVQRIIEKKSI